MEIDEIYQSMKASVEDGSGVYINNGGDMALRLYAVAAELYSLWTQADWLQRQSFPQTATGELLDRHAQLRSLERRAGTCAEGELCFAISETRESEIGVPAGTVCLNSAGVEFITLAGGAIAPGETVCTVRAKAREAGRFGNAPAESISRWPWLP